MFLQLQIKVTILQFGFLTGTVCSEPSHLHSVPMAKNTAWRPFPLEMPGTCQPTHDRESAHGNCLQKCSERKYCHCTFKFFTWASILETTWAEGLPSGSVCAGSALESSSPPKTLLPVGHSDPVTINKSWKSHETEWKMLEKQFQDGRISPLKLGSSFWKAIGRLVIWSNRVLTSARNACCHLISGDILLLHGQMPWSHILKLLSDWAGKSPTHIKSKVTFQLESSVEDW